MYRVTHEDVIAVHRAHHHGGREGALVEVRRRWAGIAEGALGDALDQVLAVQVHGDARSAKRDDSAAGVCAEQLLTDAG